jgi:hypothetical protein
MKPVKLLEIKGVDWMKGISLQSTLQVGGIFKTASYFDPFSAMGMMQPTISPTAVSSIVGTAKFITPVVVSGVTYLYCHGDSYLERVIDGSPYTRADVTAQITAGTVKGATIWKGKYIYNLASETRANAVPVASGSDIQILNGTNNTNAPYRPFCVGADGNLYFGDYGAVGRITSATGTSGNSLSGVSLEDYFQVRDLINDGRYLVILADNNGGNGAGSVVNGRFRCQVLFWDMVKGTFDQIWEFEDAYLIGGKILDGVIYVYGNDNLYACNIATYPKVLYNFRTGNGISSNATITSKPASPAAITKGRGSIYWGDSAGQKVYAYGSLIPGHPKIFYQPYTASQGNITALSFNGTTLYTATDTPALYHNAGTTRNSSVISISNITLPEPCSFSFVKVVLQTKMVSGDSLTFQLNSANDNGAISNPQTYTYSSSNPKQTFIFDRTAGSANDVEYFEEISSFTLTSNATVERIEIWGVPQEPHSSAI